MVDICWIAIDKLTPNGRNARTHSRKQIRQIADSITAFGFVVPILIDEDGVIIACPSRKSYPRVAMMQSGQDWYGDDGPRLLDGPS